MKNSYSKIYIIGERERERERNIKRDRYRLPFEGKRTSVKLDSRLNGMFRHVTKTKAKET